MRFFLGLMAVEEAVCISVQGVNQLAPNSLVDIVVFLAYSNRVAEIIGQAKFFLKKPLEKDARRPLHG
ncbi:hypothetical protein L2E82_18456 [Cichorium intybus]|uniref:Uncharacterized protein n=1 Tax=Cichorium intybus TaxID=13427 RepID=A0ACB9FAQ3_CICIN|nr:hypothetical protein L2E82_18456 [Cichorium intybus]